VSLTQLINENLVLLDLYVGNGVQFPRFESFMRIDSSRNLIIAVKLNDMLADLDEQPLYCRFYTNAYFASQRSTDANRRFVKTEGIRVGTQTQLLQFQARIRATLQELGGFPFYYVNGRFVQEVSLVSAQVGDVVEYVLDGSVTGFKEFKLTTQPTFVSTLDKERKYILHYDDASVQSIRYIDDLEVFLYKPLPQTGRFMGVTYHRNKGDWLRMLTHKDYSISIPRLMAFITQHSTDPRNVQDPVRWDLDKWENLAQLTARVYFRHSGYDRPLEADANRIQELYKLKSAQILEAFTGNKSTNPLWKAENLEQCPYVRFMSAERAVVYPLEFGNPDTTSAGKQAAQQFAGDVYGYHAAATILADTPSKVYTEGGIRYADLCYEHWYDATLFEYDQTGRLLGYHYHTAGRRYRVVDSKAYRVEAITGQGGDRMNTVFGPGSVPIPTGYNFRLYLSTVWAGVSQGDWKDITEAADLAQYGYLDDTTSDRKWVWTADASRFYGAVRIDNQFLVNELTFTRTAGLLQFSVGSIETNDTEEAYSLMEIPFGQFDLFIKDDSGAYRFLIENLDYVVQWPRVVINNLEYLASGNQSVLYRGYSFCNPDFSRPKDEDIGFVLYGVLSNNDQYDVHSHKVQRVVIDGHYRDRSELVYEEDLNGLVIGSERNGAPYVIQTPPVRFKDVYDSDKLARAEDDARDLLVKQYMQMYYPTRTRPNPDTITRQYHVFSVFANKVLTDLLSGKLNPAGIADHYADTDIKTWLASYEWILPYDLCNREYNETYVQVLPHWFGTPQGLQAHKYDFFIRILDLYLRKRPDVSPFVYVVR